MSTNVTAPIETRATLEEREQARARAQLEHSLATAFVELQRERNPGERTRLWTECLRLSKELERLNGNEAKHTNEPG